jgi:hypothetical protein
MTIKEGLWRLNTIANMLPYAYGDVGLCGSILARADCNKKRHQKTDHDIASELDGSHTGTCSHKVSGGKAINNVARSILLNMKRHGYRDSA